MTAHGSTRSSAKSVLTDNVLILQKAAVPVKPEVKKQDALQVTESGLGLSDDDDTQALEREAAVCSPPKGKKRATSSVSVQWFSMAIFDSNVVILPIMQALVKQSPSKPAARQTERKKPGNNNLPDGVDQKLWRRVFISTYMQYVATTPNPWEVPVKLGCEKMQVIWDVIFPSIPYVVTSTSTVYFIVRVSYVTNQQRY